LIRSVGGVPQNDGEAPDLGIDPAHLALVHEGMWRVSNGSRGTAYRSRVADEAFAIAGKTGTSQVRNITAAERAAGVIGNEDLPWERRDHALFVGFAPYDAPRYAVSVLVEHGGGGSVAAAPIGRDVLLRAMVGDVPPPELYPVSDRRSIEEMHRNLPIFPSPPVPTGRTLSRA
jgi:penicillin-binding protein 2